MQRMRWEHFEHGADIGLRVVAATREEIFTGMGAALTGVVSDVACVRATLYRDIEVAAPDDPLLLVDWLNALIYLMATEHLLFSAWQVELDDHCLRARVNGEPIDRERHQPAVEIKGATYTALEMTQANDGTWRAQCVVDV